VHYEIGTTLAQQGRLDEAIIYFRKALRIKPDFADAHYSLAMALEAQGILNEAIYHYNQALSIEPNWPLPLNGIAWILAEHPDPNMRNPRQAVELAEKAARLTNYQDASILDTLAAGYASAGRFDKAVVTAQKALSLALAEGNDQLINHIRKRLEIYGQAKR
jgi:Flp pilus assembly protein TadD